MLAYSHSSPSVVPLQLTFGICSTIVVAYQWYIPAQKASNIVGSIHSTLYGPIRLSHCRSFCLYLFWFWLHFTILYRSGPGDDFMSPAFQATLADNPMTSQARDIHYYDVITIMHKDTKAYLHSHPAQYPLRYDDGRISSQGQQVTGYPFNDTNNHWIVLPSEQESVQTESTCLPQRCG